MSNGKETGTWVRWVIGIAVPLSVAVGAFALQQALAAQEAAAEAKLSDQEVKEYASALAKETLKAAIQEARREVDQHRKLEELPQIQATQRLSVQVDELSEQTTALKTEVRLHRRQRHR